MKKRIDNLRDDFFEENDLIQLCVIRKHENAYRMLFRDFLQSTRFTFDASMINEIDSCENRIRDILN